MELELSFREKILRTGYVSIKDFTKYASEIQKILYTIGKDKDPASKRYVYDLLIKDTIKKRSQVFELIPHIQTTLFGFSPLEKAIETFQEIAKVLDGDVNGSNYKKILDLIYDSNNRNELYNSLRRFTKKAGIVELSLRKPNEVEFKKIFTTKRRYYQSVVEWKKLEKKEIKIEFLGALTVLHGERTKYFGIRSEKGAYIKYKYSESEEKRFIPYYKKVLKIKGIIIPYQNMLNRIDEMEVFDTISLNKLLDLKFKHPLELKLEFMEDAFFGINEELNIVAAGKTIEDMYNDLHEGIISDIKLYIDSGRELTSGAQKLKNKLLNLIEIQGR